MDIELRVIDYPTTEALQQFARSSFDRALRRHRHFVSRVTITLRDVNGPRGGEDQWVQANIRMPGHSPLIVEFTSGDAYHSLKQLAVKSRVLVRRELERKNRRVILPLPASAEQPV